ncbi:transposable element Tcb1 transposase [Trichonephila clavipes]|uniref:Transposable element Tcb1 transposase n=1 Tax=Trichonephila clavipes TaxID=2585209 RepID=A0A8X6VJF2_TRICX|nr:transposable element Tcb1 transposase [Trichonephila clavipes]
MTTQRYVHDILQAHVLPLMQRLPGAIFQQDNTRSHTAKVSQDCLRTATALSLACPIPRFVSNQAYLGSFGTAIWASHSLYELKARLQQIRNELSQDIIHNLEVSMPDRIVSCRAFALEGVQQGLNPPFFCLFL